MAIYIDTIKNSGNYVLFKVKISDFSPLLLLSLEMTQMHSIKRWLPRLLFKEFWENIKLYYNKNEKKNLIDHSKVFFYWLFFGCIHVRWQKCNPLNITPLHCNFLTLRTLFSEYKEGMSIKLEQTTSFSNQNDQMKFFCLLFNWGGIKPQKPHCNFAFAIAFVQSDYSEVSNKHGVFLIFLRQFSQLHALLEPPHLLIFEELSHLHDY